MIPIFSNTLGDNELEAVRKVFSSRWLGKGKECSAFEDEFARHIGTDRTMLFNCCTSGTYGLLKALGIGAGDEVIVPSIQFVGVANAVLEMGAKVRFADVDPMTLNLLPEEVWRLKNRQTKAVFLLHYGGHPVPMKEIRRAAVGLFVLEDAANAVSSTYDGVACGTLGDGGVWSFDAMKILVMGDGGTVWTRHEWAWRWLEEFRYFGFPIKNTSGTDSMRDGNPRWWEFDLSTISGRYVSNDILASIGRVQLGRLQTFVERRREVWDIYQTEFSGIDELETPPEVPDGCTGTYYLYWIMTDRRDELARHLVDNGIYCTFRYYPLHLVSRYGSTERLPNAERAGERGLCLPLHQNLTDQDVERIVGEVKRFFSG